MKQASSNRSNLDHGGGWRHHQIKQGMQEIKSWSV
jgi:hypothetical protein